MQSDELVYPFSKIWGALQQYAREKGQGHKAGPLDTHKLTFKLCTDLPGCTLLLCPDTTCKPAWKYCTVSSKQINISILGQFTNTQQTQHCSLFQNQAIITVLNHHSAQ